MDRDAGAALMLDALSGFHGKFKTLYGQMALRLDENSYLMTDGNKAFAGLGDESFVVCDINTGSLGEIFTRNKAINALIFGCTQDIVAVSETEGTYVPVCLEDLAQLTGPRLSIAAGPDTSSLLAALSSSSVCLIRGTGALAAGSNLRKAAAGIQIVEKACEAEVHGRLIGGTRPIPEDIASQIRRDFTDDYVNRNESDYVAYMQFDEDDFALRSKLIECGKELVRRDLAYGSWGNISVRASDSEMLITPSSIDYFEIKPEDIVRLDINKLEYGTQRVPSSLTAVHAALYREFPECGAVIHTHSNAMSVFAACGAGFAVPEPDLNSMIGDVLVTDPARPNTLEIIKTVTDTLSRTHAAILPHHGAVFTAPSLEIVLAIAEAVEARARNLLGF